MQWLGYFGLLVLSYLLGSLPSGYLAGRWLKGVDIRDFGSGSMGATNVLRTLGKGPAAVVFAIDVLKGTLVIVLARTVTTGDEQSAWVVLLAGLLAILGHSRPVWLAFRGGKSVAVSIGLLLGMQWQVALAVAAVWGLCFAATRIVSLGSVCGAIATPIFFYLWGAPLPFTLFGLLGGTYVVWLHRSNIARLRKGTEPRVGSAG